jgi:hypothetical protein
VGTLTERPSSSPAELADLLLLLLLLLLLWPSIYLSIQ